jgi:tetratricopeptide (TPR) repeat protein
MRLLVGLGHAFHPFHWTLDIDSLDGQRDYRCRHFRPTFRTARAHFLVLLTPSALDRCGDPADWLRREIETALSSHRNIVPLMLEGFDFGSPPTADRLTGTLAPLKRYNGLSIPPEYFMESMDRLRVRFLNVPLDSVLHPVSPFASQVARTQKAAACAAPTIVQEKLTAQQWFERGNDADDLDEKIRFYSEAIRLDPDDADSYYNRGDARYENGDMNGALQDYNRGIGHKPDATAYVNRGVLRKMKGDVEGALQDYNEAIRLQPEFGVAYYNRGKLRDQKGGLEDYNKAIQLGYKTQDVNRFRHS